MGLAYWVMAGALTSLLAWLVPRPRACLFIAAVSVFTSTLLAMLAATLPELLYGACITVLVVFGAWIVWGSIIMAVGIPLGVACGQAIPPFSQEQRPAAPGKVAAVVGCVPLIIWLYVRWILSHPVPSRVWLLQQTLLPFSTFYSFETVPAPFVQIVTWIASALMLAGLLPVAFWLHKPQSQPQMQNGSDPN